MMVKQIVSVGVACLALVASAMPTKKELKGVQRLVNELMAGDIAAAKAGRMKPREVAANAEAYARDAETEAAKFLLLKGSFGYYMQGGEYGEALRVLDLLTTSVGDVPDKVLAEIVGAKLKKLDRERGGEVFAYYERISRRMSMGEERAKLEKALKENPKSKEAHGDLAVCLATLGDWKGACAHFAEAGGKEAEAARMEMSGKVAGAADLWWDLATGETEEIFKSHAAELYRAAIADGKLKGLKKTLVQKRIAEVSPGGEAGMPPQRRGGIPAAPDRRRDVPVASNEKSETPPPAAPAGAATPRNDNLDWSLPAKFQGVRTFDLDVGCADKMSFVAVPPGRAEMWQVGDFQITRPFWISQFAVTKEQFEALGFRCLDPSLNERLDELTKACQDDPSVAVMALASDYQTESFCNALNEKFGSTLPPGFVFRPPTVVEGARVITWRLDQGLRKDFKAANADLLKAFKKKGFFADCADEQEMNKKQWSREPGHILCGAFCPDYAKLKNAGRRMPQNFERLCCHLDTISMPGLERVHHFDPRVMGEARKRMQSAEMKRENPFLYCEKGTPERRIGIGHTAFVPEGLGGAMYTIRVAVGYDYVGEWMRQHGKK